MEKYGFPKMHHYAGFLQIRSHIPITGMIWIHYLKYGHIATVRGKIMAGK